VHALVLTHRLAYPPDKGERIRAWHWICALAEQHDVDVLSLADETPSEIDLCEIRQVVRRIDVVPRSKLSLPCRALAAMIQGHSLTQAWFGSRRFNSLLRRRIAETRYDACLAICSSVGAYTLDLPESLRLIVDLIDVDSAKWQRYAQTHRSLRRFIYSRESRTVAELERRLQRRADAIVAVSEQECSLLDQHVDGVEIAAIGNGVDTEFFSPTSDDDTPSTYNALVFVGQMDYFPNVDAVMWFVKEVWPALRRACPKLTLRIVGRNPLPAVRQLAADRRILVSGTVDDVRPYLRGAIAIAPLRVACGVQNKVLEAMASACPVVISSSVHRSLQVQPQQEVLVADSAAEWAAALTLLVADPHLAQTLAANARAAMLDRYAWPRMEQQMRDCVQRIVERPAGRAPSERASTVTPPKS
jgi:sugar transferase (PEP-CTERM/EpsH1 system associated)